MKNRDIWRKLENDDYISMGDVLTLVPTDININKRTGRQPLGKSLLNTRVIDHKYPLYGGPEHAIYTLNYRPLKLYNLHSTVKSGVYNFWRRLRDNEAFEEGDIYTENLNIEYYYNSMTPRLIEVFKTPSCSVNATIKFYRLTYKPMKIRNIHTVIKEA